MQESGVANYDVSRERAVRAAGTRRNRQDLNGALQIILADPT